MIVRRVFKATIKRVKISIYSTQVNPVDEHSSFEQSFVFDTDRLLFRTTNSSTLPAVPQGLIHSWHALQLLAETERDYLLAEINFTLQDQEEFVLVQFFSGGPDLSHAQRPLFELGKDAGLLLLKCILSGSGELRDAMYLQPGYVCLRLRLGKFLDRVWMQSHDALLLIEWRNDVFEEYLGRVSASFIYLAPKVNTRWLYISDLLFESSESPSHPYQSLDCMHLLIYLSEMCIAPPYLKHGCQYLSAQFLHSHRANFLIEVSCPRAVHLVQNESLHGSHH